LGGIQALIEQKAAAFGGRSGGHPFVAVKPLVQVRESMARTDVTAQADIVIAGGGYAGLTLALALGQALGSDRSIVVIDRGVPRESPSSDPRALAISTAAKRMFHVLGVWPRVADEAQPIWGIQLTDSSLNAGIRPVLLTFDNTDPCGEPASYILPSAVLGPALVAAAAAVPSLTVLTSAAATGFEADERGVTVRLADGRSIRAALLVAADGRRSPLRHAAGIQTVEWSYAQAGIVTTVAHERPHGGRAVQHFLPGGPFAILPLKGNRSSITWSEHAERACEILALDDQGFLAELDKRVGGRLGAIRLDGPRVSWPLAMHLARRYVARRFALLGDAAHGVHPIAGQGLNLAIRDAAALTEVVADAVRLGLDLGEGAALERYEQWRRFDSALSAASFDALNRLFSNDWALLRSAREFGLGLVDRMPVLKQLFVQEAAGLSGELPRLLKGEPV
jgi:2-octaprenyl-6-methoxyphenol hydroxylase